MGQERQYKGMKFGHLTAEEYLRYDSKVGASIWNFRCDCGNHKEIPLKVVTAGRIKTCGNCELKHKLRQESRGRKIRVLANVRRLYSRYINKAADEGRGWNLSIENFRTICESNCRLCGSAPSVRMRGSILPINIPILVETQTGYTVENTKAACKRCEEKYGKVGISQAVIEIIREYNHLTH